MTFAAVVEQLQTLENPYPGLRHFDVDESHLFFGRDLQVAELVRRLERDRFVAVLGVSGSGKSSLVSAGLIPALERGGVWEAGTRWRRVITRPAGAPFERLAADLANAGLDASGLRKSSHGLIEIAGRLPADETLLLVVDQFEELFRYKDLEPISAEMRQTRDRRAAEAAEFVQLLLEASIHYPPIYIVITMRSDYLGDCAEFRDFPEKLNECQYLVPRMTRTQRKEAIEGPLGRVKIAPAVVQRMLNDAGDEPGQLPVLQHALMRTWNRWRASDPEQKRPIGVEDYDKIGGFEGALNVHADELLGTVREDIAACIFKRLTARGRSSRERRDPATVAELWAVCGAVTAEERKQVTEVIDRFRGSDATFLRPLTGDLEPTTYVDITHESLIRLWKKLRDKWLPDEQLSAKTLLELADRARNKKAGSGELLRGQDVVRVDEWDRSRNRAPAWAKHYVDEATLTDVVAFVEASRARERRRVRSRIGRWVTIGLLVVTSVGVLVVNRIREQQRQQREIALEQQRKLQRERNEEESRRAQAEAELVAAQTAVVQARVDSASAPGGALLGGRGSRPTASEQTPRVYTQVRDQADVSRARALAASLEQAGFIVPRPEVVKAGPSANEVRFFREAERSTGEKIVRVLAQSGVPDARLTYVQGYEDSRAMRPNHFELWLTPADLLPTLVRQLNDVSVDVRKAAGARLARDQRANPEAIRLVLDTLSAQNLPALSPDGRINALYFLDQSDRKAWSDELARTAREMIDRIRSNRAAAVGPQTLDKLQTLEQLLASP